MRIKMRRQFQPQHHSVYCIRIAYTTTCQANGWNDSRKFALFVTLLLSFEFMTVLDYVRLDVVHLTYLHTFSIDFKLI